MDSRGELWQKHYFEEPNSQKKAGRLDGPFETINTNSAEVTNNENLWIVPFLISSSNFRNQLELTDKTPSAGAQRAAGASIGLLSIILYDSCRPREKVMRALNPRAEAAWPDPLISTNQIPASLFQSDGWPGQVLGPSIFGCCCHPIKHTALKLTLNGCPV